MAALVSPGAPWEADSPAGAGMRQPCRQEEEGGGKLHLEAPFAVGETLESSLRPEGRDWARAQRGKHSWWR